MTTIRTASLEDAPALARVHVDTWRTNYTGIVPEEHLAAMSYESRQTRWEEVLGEGREDVRTFVAEDEAGEVIGFACGGRIREALEDYDGELYAIYIRKSCQGLGTGRRLVEAVARFLNEQSLRSMVIWVLDDNPACRFYAALGGQPVAEKAVEIGGKWLMEVAYGWPAERMKKLLGPTR